MQLEGLMFMIFLLVIIPILIMSANHNIFFVAVAFVLFLAAVKKIYLLFFNIKQETEESDEELLDDLEMSLNLNVRKFGKGTKVVKDLIIILFMAYCALYVNAFWLKIFISFCTLYWINDIIVLLRNSNTSVLKIGETVRRFFELFLNLGTVLLIIIVACNKFINTRI